MSESNLMIRDHQGVTVVTLQESAIIETRAIEQIAEDLYELADKQHKQRIILDFSSVKLLASQMLGVLLTLQKKVSAIKGELVLCTLRDELKQIFRITNLDKKFKFCADVAEALAHFESR